MIGFAMRGWDRGDGYHLIDYYTKDHDDNPELHHQHQVIVKYLQGLSDFTKITTTSGSNGTRSANGLEGYATLNGSTTRGAGVSTITVASLTSLRDAVTGTSPKIVRLSIIIQGDGDPVDIGSNTSILGSCGGFRLKKSSNVIIRNLKLQQVQLAPTFWVDHNEFYSDMDSGENYYDGACDIKHRSDWVTLGVQMLTENNVFVNAVKPLMTLEKGGQNSTQIPAMYKKFKDKLHIGSPGSGRRSPSPNARNAGDGSTRWETLLNATQTTLAIAKESVAGLPVPGLEAAIGGLLKVLTIYQGMKSNEEAIKSFNEAVVRLNDNVAAPLKAAIASQLDFVDDDLQKRLELLVKDLTDLTKRTETMSSREQRRKFSSTQDDLGIIQELNRELDRIVMAFIGRGSISAEMEARAGKRMAQTLVIDKLPRAQARHDSASRVGANPCFQGTRNGILKEISAWIDDPNTRPIFWLSGMAGIGKSTIAQTIAEQEEKKHRLAASFFFSRDEADRRNSHLVYPTIALQLAGFDGSLREPIAQALERDADIGHAIMQKQFENLIAGPLVKLKARATTLLFVLDALDECSSADGAREILTRWALELPRISTQVGVALKVLITSRPELHIHDEFNHPSLRLISQSFVLHDIERSVVQADIELFLTQRLVGLAARHGVGIPWPTVAEVNALVSRSDNLFIFASTTVNFIGGVKSGRSLQHRLDRLLKPDPNHTTSAFAQLDALYHRVLEDAENDLEETIPNSKETFRSVLEAVVLILDPLPSTSLAALLSLQHDDVLTTVQDLRSILVIPAASESSEPIRFFHPSFYDFITTPGRQSGRFLITSSEGHARLAKLCLETMHSLLEKDPCSLGSPWVLHSDVADLQVRLDMAAPTHLRYSCRFFGSHISLSPRGDEALGHLLDVFCESKLLMWLEMMSLLGDIDGAIHSIQLLKSWCHNNPGVQKLTIDLVHDAYRVLLQFQSPLRLSSGHLYTTALSFIPACSLTRPYGSQRRANYVVRGKPAQWDANLITADAQSQLSTLAYFPDGKRIVTGGREGLITVWNSSTGAEISSLGEPEEGVGELDVSGDGARIAAWESDARKFSIDPALTSPGSLQMV
ncbi:hypothetical protein FRC04_011880 [Tulasnella sp. 424]|nr:hypothetical protein FRC04_011880 [Tulasnella sp. 424]